jgi:Family of unknown function (DUF6225)
MQCTAHGADGCAECTPGMRAAWTVGQLKTALAAIPDATALVVNVADPSDPHVADEQVIVGAGFGTIDWGDGRGPQTDPVFGLDCEIPERLMRLAPDRPSRLPGPGSDLLAWCQDYTTAIRNAEEMVQARRHPVHGGALADEDQFWDVAAAQVLGCYLHAAALAGLRARAVKQWLDDPASTTAAEILAMHPGAGRHAASTLRNKLGGGPSETKASIRCVAAAAFVFAQKRPPEVSR